MSCNKLIAWELCLKTKQVQTKIAIVYLPNACWNYQNPSSALHNLINQANCIPINVLWIIIEFLFFRSLLVSLRNAELRFMLPEGREYFVQTRRSDYWFKYYENIRVQMHFDDNPTTSEGSRLVQIIVTAGYINRN